MKFLSVLKTTVKQASKANVYLTTFLTVAEAAVLLADFFKKQS